MVDDPEVEPAEVLPELSVVLPAHNEVLLLGSSVATIVTALAERVTNFEVLIVENGSRDGTLRLARLLAAQIPTVRVLTLPVADYGAALRAGFRASRGALVVNFDVDYYDFDFLDAASAIARAGDAAIVVASKRAPGARDRRPLHRRLLTAIFASLLQRVLNLGVSDAHGMKVIDRRLVAPIVEICGMHGSLFDVEMVLRANQSGLAVVELPIVVLERRPPRTSVWNRAVESFFGIFRLRMRFAYEQGVLQGGLMRAAKRRVKDARDAAVGRARRRGGPTD